MREGGQKEACGSERVVWVLEGKKKARLGFLRWLFWDFHNKIGVQKNKGGTRRHITFYTGEFLGDFLNRFLNTGGILSTFENWGK